MKGLFITGTDTEVGKTEVASAIAHLLRDQGRVVKPRKPVASGCRKVDGAWRCEDTDKLMAASGTGDRFEQVTPYAYREPVAPFLAARKAGQPITIQQLSDACWDQQDECEGVLLVEGAGGFYTPIAEDGLCADLAKRLRVEVVLVIKNRLGCINHAILTINCISAENLALHSVILNDAENCPTMLADNLAAIKRYSGERFFSLPHLAVQRTRWPLMSGHLKNQGWKL